MRKFKRKKRYKCNKLIPLKELCRIMINEELRPYKITTEDIKQNPKWYDEYQFKTESQETVWLDFCNKLIRKHLYPWYITKKQAKRELSMFILNYGLTSEYLLHES